MNPTQLTQILRRMEDFRASFKKTIVHTASKENHIADALYRNYERPSTSTEAEDYIPQSIDNTTLHRVPTLPTSPHTITCKHFSLPHLTLDMSKYQSSSTSDFSHTDCKNNLCSSRATPGDHYHSCPHQDDNDGQQFIEYSDDSEIQDTNPPTVRQQEPESAPFTPIDSALFEVYSALTVEQIVAGAGKEDIVRMYDHYKQYTQDHWTNSNDEYYKPHDSSHLNQNRHLNPDCNTCSVGGTWGHGLMTCDMEGLMLEKVIKELTKECMDSKVQALTLLPYHQAQEWATA